jgi:hypothetical protein
VCSVACAETAGRSGGFTRAWRRSTDAAAVESLIDQLRREFAENPRQNRVHREKTVSSVVVAECLAGSPADDVRNQ